MSKYQSIIETVDSDNIYIGRGSNGAKYCHGHVLLACSEWLNSL